jgi:peptide/nickel transport system substrate-binding protein
MPKKCAQSLGPIIAILLLACAAPQRAAEPARHAGASAPSTPAAPKRVVATIRSAPVSLVQQKTHPAGLVGSVSGLDALEELVQAGLSHADDRGARQPQLAEAVPSLENGLWDLLPDGRMETTWRIKDSARWQDGAPLTSADLVFATQVEQDRDLGIPRNAVYDLIEAIETPDAHSAKVTWKQPYTDAVGLFSFEVALPLPRHLLDRPYAEDKANFLGLPYWTHGFVGAGPYRIAEWVPDSHTIVRANDTYVLGKPKIDEIEVRFIPDPSTIVANLLAGAVEMTIGRALGLDQALQLRDQWRDGHMALRGGTWIRITPQFVNPNPPVVSDVRFRRALLHAVDRQELVDSLMGGLSGIAHTFVGPETPEYREIEHAIVRYEFDPRRAIQLIDEIGYARGRDGFFVDAANQRLTVELRGPVQNPVHPKAVAAIADYWQQAGVAVEQFITPLQRGQDREFLATYPAFELILIGNDVNSRGVRRYHSSQAPVPENRFQVTGNEARYRNPELDGLIERFLTTIPWRERMQALAGIVQHQTDRVTVMGMSYSVSPTMIANRVQNVTTGSSGGARSTEAWNAHEWDTR